MPGVTDISICNLALARIGASRITSFTDGSEEASLCSDLYDPARRETLRSHAWGFATDTATLALATGETDTKYDYVYALPAKCIRAVKLVNPSNDDELAFRVRKDRLLYCNVADAELEYVYDVEDESRFDPMFVSALAFRLAADLAVPVAQSKSLADTMFQKFMLLIRSTTGVDSSEGKAELKTGQSFINARK